MNPNLLEQFLGPSTQFFCFNSNDINVLVTPIDKKTCLLTKRNVITTTKSTNLKSSSSYAEKSRSTTRLNSSNVTKSADLNSSFSSTTSVSTAKINQSTPKLARKNSFRTTKITIKEDKKIKPIELDKDDSTIITDNKSIVDLKDEANKSINDDESLTCNDVDKEDEETEEENVLNRTYDEVSTDLDKTELPHIDSNDFEECKCARSTQYFCNDD